MRKILTAVALLTLTTGVARSQAPDSDIFLVSLAKTGNPSDPGGEKLVVTGARNLTKRPGYDNQPNWSRDGSTLFFTSVREDGQADIYRLNPATGEATRVTMTSPEREYSASPIPNKNAISVIRVERDSTQRLWSVPLDGSPKCRDRVAQQLAVTKRVAEVDIGLDHGRRAFDRATQGADGLRRAPRHAQHDAEVVPGARVIEVERKRVLVRLLGVLQAP